MADGHDARPSQALVLAGHGSHRSADSAAPVYAHAARIRALGVFDEVIETFWKEEPSLRDALRLVESDEVYVVPLFLSEGYFTRLVLPRELHAASSKQVVRRTAPVGTHPAMIDLVLRRALEAVPGTSGLAETTLLIAAHGTERTTGSGGTTYRLRDALRARRAFAHVECGFLDEAPGVLDVLQQVGTRNVVIVPFFMSAGWHVGTTLPEDLALDESGARNGERRVIYTPPVGTLQGVADIALELAVEAGARLADASSSARASNAAMSSTAIATSPASTVEGAVEGAAAARAREEFIHWVDEAGSAGRTFMQVHIRRAAADCYELRHRTDVGRDPNVLERGSTADIALDIARAGREGGHRPLRSAPDLRRGWLLERLRATELWSALAWFYPAAAVCWAELRAGTLEAESFADVASRQTGIYAAVGTVPPSSLREVVRTCCDAASCLRTPVWVISGSEHEAAHARAADLLPHGPVGETIVPCVRPCSVFLDAAVAALPAALDETALPPIL